MSNYRDYRIDERGALNDDLVGPEARDEERPIPQGRARAYSSHPLFAEPDWAP